MMGPIVSSASVSIATSPKPDSDEVLSAAESECDPDNAAPVFAAPSSSNTTHSQPIDPADTANHENTTGGDGGCTAVALHNLGIFPSVLSAVLALDAQIPPLRIAFLAQGHGYNAAGIPGEQWHESVIMQAIWDTGWHAHSVAIDPTNPPCVELKSLLKTDSYLIIGKTNNAWSKCVKGKKKRQPLKYPTEDEDAPATEPGWVHSIVVKDGSLYDFDANFPISCLWLDGNNQPDPYHGYMRTIRKVWRVYKCADGKPGCKGKCVPNLYSKKRARP